jgi:signal transduction histidine kinase
MHCCPRKHNNVPVDYSNHWLYYFRDAERQVDVDYACVAFLVIHSIFLIQYFNPGHRFSEKINDLVTVAITYSILYFILTFATGILKRAYDKIYQSLRASHMELHQKASEMASQNEVLVQTQENLNALNSRLEVIISERTAKIQAQNETLLKYSYTNAHDLRGPVARLLGLASVYRLEGNKNGEFIIEKMEEQANEIDAVVKKINTDLESSSNGIEKKHPIKELE